MGKLEDVKATPGCLYFAMPVHAYDTLGFGKFTEILNVGLKAGREVLAKWKEEGRLPSGLVDDVKAKQAISRGTKLRCEGSVDIIWERLLMHTCHRRMSI